ncbi:sulfotransferase [Thiohalobacter sp. IOR34]|uniref:sulfotransferase family protein n=1 Tax=Thiohalobacter sp. IOR34 TaxID=3057176 RepID=UPI0025B0C98B|nr:sulfotransferase [Thiohalobacter sp. IOR34]WJW75309.1 sulfotransferase [Thiohalobacter sp. IOR34]
MRLERFPQTEIRIRQWVKAYRRTSRLFRAWLMPWVGDIKPDFLGIGAPRAASTWLHNRLARHPQIYLPHEKELHYFDVEDARGGYRYRLDSPLHRRWYSLCFKAGHGCVKGDVTPAYSILPIDRIKEMAAYLPGVKIIYILRNPIERAWSVMRRRTWYGYGAKAGDTGLDYLVGLTHDEGILIRGDYRRNIEAWESVVPVERIHYMFFDDIQVDGDKELRRVCEFLGVDSELLPESKQGSKPVNFAPASNMPAVVRQALVRYYEKDREFLEQKFGRDLGYWYDA